MLRSVIGVDTYELVSKLRAASITRKFRIRHFTSSSLARRETILRPGLGQVRTLPPHLGLVAQVAKVRFPSRADDAVVFVDAPCLGFGGNHAGAILGPRPQEDSLLAVRATGLGARDLVQRAAAGGTDRPTVVRRYHRTFRCKRITRPLEVCHGPPSDP